MTLNSECIDISALACPELTFWYNMTENPSYLGYMGSLAVTVNGTAVWSYGPGLNTSSCNNGWCLAVVDLSAFANETNATLSFIGTVGLNGYSDVSFDAVGVDGDADDDDDDDGDNDDDDDGDNNGGDDDDDDDDDDGDDGGIHPELGVLLVALLSQFTFFTSASLRTSTARHVSVHR